MSRLFKALPPTSFLPWAIPLLFALAFSKAGLAAEEEGCLKQLGPQLHVWTCGKPIAVDSSSDTSEPNPASNTTYQAPISLASAHAEAVQSEQAEFHGLHGSSTQTESVELQSAFVLSTRRKTVLIGAETLANPVDFASDVKKAFPKHTHFILQSAESCNFPQSVQSVAKVLRLKTEWGPKRKRYSRQYISNRALNAHLEESCKGKDGKGRPTGIFSSTPMVGDSGTLGFLDPELKSWYYLVRREGRPSVVQVDLLNKKDSAIFINQRGPGRGLYGGQELDFLAQLHLASKQSKLTLLLPIGVWDPDLLGETVVNLVEDELQEAIMAELIGSAAVADAK